MGLFHKKEVKSYPIEFISGLNAYKDWTSIITNHIIVIVRVRNISKGNQAKISYVKT